MIRLQRDIHRDPIGDLNGHFSRKSFTMLHPGVDISKPKVAAQPEIGKQ